MHRPDHVPFRALRLAGPSRLGAARPNPGGRFGAGRPCVRGIGEALVFRTSRRLRLASVGWLGYNHLQGARKLASAGVFSRRAQRA